MNRKVIELPDLYPGWCSSCNILYSTAVKDSDGRYCCERCGDYLLFDSEELIERVATLTEQLEQRDQELAQARAGLEQMSRPVTDEEWAKVKFIGSHRASYRENFDALLAARACRQEKP